MSPKTLRTLRLSSIVASLCLAAIVWFGSGCGSTKPVEFPPHLLTIVTNYLAPGDVLKFTFPGSLELNQIQPIRADGKITLSLVGEVEAAGLTVGDLQAKVSRLYEPQLQLKEVIVTLESTVTVVYVSGAVNRPGKVPLIRPMTALEIIMEAGGFTPGVSDGKRVVLIRQSEGTNYSRIFDLTPSLRGERTEAFQVRAYDMIHVPERVFRY